MESRYDPLWAHFLLAAAGIGAHLFEVFGERVVEVRTMGPRED